VEPTTFGPILIFCPPELVLGGTDGVRSRFHVLRSQTRLGRTEGVGSCFHVFRSRTHFRRYRRSRVPFSCFVLPDSFGTAPKARGLVFMFCALGIVSGRTKGIRSRFQVLRSLTRFWRYLGRRVLFSYFVLPNSFSTVPRVSGRVFMFCAHELVSGGTEGVGYRFQVLRSRTRFRRYRG
jgi:hypothetical protein